MSDSNEETITIEGKRVGFFDFVQVTPSAPGRRDGFIGKVKGWWITDDGTVSALDVWGGKPQHEKMRSVRPDRIVVLNTKKQNALQRAAGKIEVDG